MPKLFSIRPKHSIGHGYHVTDISRYLTTNRPLADIAAETQSLFTFQMSQDFSSLVELKLWVQHMCQTERIPLKPFLKHMQNPERFFALRIGGGGLEWIDATKSGCPCIFLEARGDVLRFRFNLANGELFVDLPFESMLKALEQLLVESDFYEKKHIFIKMLTDKPQRVSDLCAAINDLGTLVPLMESIIEENGYCLFSSYDEGKTWIGWDWTYADCLFKLVKEDSNSYESDLGLQRGNVDGN